MAAIDITSKLTEEQAEIFNRAHAIPREQFVGSKNAAFEIIAQERGCSVQHVSDIYNEVNEVIADSLKAVNR